MVDRTANQNSAVPLPTEDFLQAARRARGEALRGMILALVKWAAAGAAARPSGSAAGSHAMRLSPKR